VADDRAASVLAAPVLERYRHYLKQKRAWRPHLLSEPEEKVLDQKSVTGRAAFVRLFDESVSSIVFPFELAGVREDLSLSQILAKLHDADRVVRRAAADSLTRGLQANCRLLTFLFNNLVLDHRVDCDLRRFADPMAPRHLDNQISDAEVAALMTAAEVHFPVVQRYYRLKARLLGVEPLYDFDRYAPLFSDLPRCDWSQACRVVRESYAAFSPRAGEVIRQFFDRSWIDAELRAGKRGGAFCASTVTSAHPYILMNYTDKLRDVMTLAHELGHGLHQYLSRPVGYLQCHTPLTMAETASVFGEMLTFERLMKEYDEPRTRLALLCSKLEDSFSTVFRQVVLTRFEQAAHRARREQGELAPERIHQIWLDANRPMHGDVVQLTEGYGCWWMYIPHFIHTPFYCYAYAFGELLVLALVQKYRAEGLAFVRQYLEMLSSGGSDSPQRLLSRMGIDVTDPGFWSLGLQLLDGMVTEAESLAAKL
jgi:oligoendopeptidase F